MKTVKKINLDLANHGIIPTVDAVQGDEMTRQLQISLYSDGQAFNLTGDEMISVAFEKPDGKRGWYDTLPNGERAVETDQSKSNLITVSLAPAMLEIPGVVKTAVIFKNRDNHQLASFPFVVNVEKNPAAYSEISNEYYSIRTYDEFYTKLLASFVSGNANQAFNSKQKDQARKNINAMEDKDIIDVKSIDFIGSNQGEYVGLTSGEGPDQDTAALILRQWEDRMNPPIIRNVSGGVEDNDVATVGQLNAAVGDIETAKLDKPETAPAVGKVLKVKSVNEDGRFTCEWADDTGAVDDVHVNGESIVTDGVANIPVATTSKAGIVWPHPTNFTVANDGYLIINQCSKSNIDVRGNGVIKPPVLDYAVKAAMCDGKGDAWTEDEQASARTRMGIDVLLGDIETTLDSIIAIQEELIGIITFTIGGTTYTSLKGMTWSQWCVSKYNYSNHAYVGDDGIVYDASGDVIVLNDVVQYGTTALVDGAAYLSL